MENAAKLETQLVESVTHIRTVKEFGIEDFSNLKTENRFVKLLFTSYKSGLNSVFAGTFTQILSAVFTIILMWIGSGYVIDRAITPGELFSFYALIGYFTSPLASLIGMNKTVQNTLIAADRLFEIMDLEREETENKVELQRIAIARALYKNPEVLLMDEATSSLDTNAVRIVKEVIDNFKAQGKTVIVIAHRLSTIANTDTILVMDNGTIVESGNHEELMKLNGKYYDLWGKQGVL